MAHKDLSLPVKISTENQNVGNIFASPNFLTSCKGSTALLIATTLLHLKITNERDAILIRIRGLKDYLFSLELTPPTLLEGGLFLLHH